MRRRPLIFATAALLAAAGLALLTLNRQGPPPAAAPALPAFAPPPPPAAAAAKLRPAVAAAASPAPDASWEQRLALLRSLPADLGPDDAAALLAALMEPCPPGVSAAVHSSYIHEIACRLQPQAAIREFFARALATLARDPQRDPTTRDYAIQHLRQVWERADGQPALREAVIRTFGELCAADPAVSASALLSLHLLGTAPVAAAAPARHAVPDAEFDPLLAPIFKQPPDSANLPARLTAARIAGERRLTAFRAPLMARLTNPAEHAMVRMAAANALGKIGDTRDLSKLAAMKPGDELVARAIRDTLTAAHASAPVR